MERAQEIYERIVLRGEAAIDEFIRDRQAEELFLDFKRSSDEGKGNALSNEDRKNLSKAISGFGNSEGGVIIWGVDCSKGKDGADVAKAKLPISDPQRFVSWIQGAVSGCTIPPHSGVEVSFVQSSEANKGFVVTHVPKSEFAPHQAVVGLHYYVRAGSNFAPTPHGVLAGLFGRRPQAQVVIQYLSVPPKLVGDTIETQVGCLITNRGRGLATDIFINATVWKTPGGKTRVGFDFPEKSWIGRIFGGFQIDLISDASFRLAPQARIQPLVMRIELCPPFEEELHLTVSVGATNSPPTKAEFKLAPTQIQIIYQTYLAKLKAGVEAEGFTQELFSLPH